MYSVYLHFLVTDPCITSGCSHTCTPLRSGHYRCECPEGLALKDHHECVKIHECDEDDDDCPPEEDNNNSTLG